jgi:hypothetical protein
MNTDTPEGKPTTALVTPDSAEKAVVDPSGSRTEPVEPNSLSTQDVRQIPSPAPEVSPTSPPQIGAPAKGASELDPKLDTASVGSAQPNTEAPPTSAAITNTPPIVPVVTPTPPPKPKPATWEVEEPKEPWCPEVLIPLLPWAQQAQADYKHNDKKELRHAGWRLVAATRRGRMHAHNAEHREDAFSWEAGDDFLVVAVSDGAGAYEWSRIGSAATTREVTGRLRDWLLAERPNLAKLDLAALVNIVGNKMVLTVHDIVKWFIEELAPKSGAKPKDFRCTLLLTVWCRTEKQEVLLTTQVGDGFFGLLRRDGSAGRHGESDSGEFSGEVTSFIPDTNAPEHSEKAIKSHRVADLEAMLLCSDGVEDPFYPLDKNSAVIFHELYHSLPVASPNAAGVKHNSAIGSVLDKDGADALAAWLGFEKKGENDDRTIVLLHRDPPAPNIRIRSAAPAA